jgi:hypothetical protein
VPLDEDIRVRWVDGRVWVEDSVSITRAVSGRELQDLYDREVAMLTAGLVSMEGASMRLGRFELVRFARPRIFKSRVDWRIEGGLLVGSSGGRFSVHSTGSRLFASLEGYHPRLPLALYWLTQLPAHHLLLRLFLLRVRGRTPSVGVPAEPSMRLVSAAIDGAVCTLLAMTLARRRRLRAWIGITAGYHVASWAIAGRTLGGAVTRQRVVAVDGSRPSVGQAVLRLLALPLALARMRAVHDEIAGTDVVAG